MKARRLSPVCRARLELRPRTGLPSAPGKQPAMSRSAATSSGVSSYMSISSCIMPFSFSTSASSKRESKNMAQSVSVARDRCVSSTRA